MAAVARAFRPLFDRVLIQRVVPAAKSKGGLYLPESATAPANEGTVVAVGDGLRLESGSFLKPAVAEGDRVLLPEFGGTKITLGGEEFVLFRDSELLGVMKQ